MNIKRRVYDALNVLIALGALKRYGNRITGKKADFEEVVASGAVEKDRLLLREKQLEQELNLVRSQFARREKVLEAKRKYFKEMKTKLDHLKSLQKRNAASQEPFSSSSLEKIRFPVVILCSQSCSHQDDTIVKKEEGMVNMELDSDDNMYMWQDNA